jgi:hypothetical protein
LTVWFGSTIDKKYLFATSSISARLKEAIHEPRHFVADWINVALRLKIRQIDNLCSGISLDERSGKEPHLQANARYALLPSKAIRAIHPHPFE